MDLCHRAYLFFPLVIATSGPLLLKPWWKVAMMVKSVLLESTPTTPPLPASSRLSLRGLDSELFSCDI